jgi:acetolactate synthase-1/2/3 large subunit
VEVCFANPGTSEMQFVDALDRTGLLRCVLGLAEGVVTGAADGYARMAGKPGVSLLHLAPGLANGAANLHNARKAGTPMLTLVGDHAVRHRGFGAPLEADVEGAARPFADWVRTATSAAGFGADAMEALAEARRGRGAVLVAPADLGWDEGGVVAPEPAPEAAPDPDPERIEAAARMLRGEGAAILVGGGVLESPEALLRLHDLRAATGADVVAPTSNRRIERGAGLPGVGKIPYPIDLALDRLSGIRRAVLVETDPPVAFFAYPGRPSLLLPEGCEVLSLAEAGGAAAIAALADAMGVPRAPVTDAPRPEAPGAGPLTPESLAAAVANALPEGAVVIDESITEGRALHDATAGAPRMSWLAITGGAIGIGPPLAAGAAVAVPDRPVVALQADGSAMYTIQALWTQAREGLNVTTIVLSNRSYKILKLELTNVGAQPGQSALDMLDLDRPALDFVAIARGMGVPGRRVEDARELMGAIRDAVREPGPFVIEAAF